MVTGAFVSLLFGVVFTYVLRREVKLPHGEGVGAWKLVSIPDAARSDQRKEMAAAAAKSNEEPNEQARRGSRDKDEPSPEPRPPRTTASDRLRRPWTSTYGARLDDLLRTAFARSWTSTSTRSRPRRWRALDDEVKPGVAYPEIIVGHPREGPRGQGLWNLFMPDEEHGAGLTNWEYGHALRGDGPQPRRRADGLQLRRARTPATWRSSPSTARASRRTAGSSRCSTATSAPASR